MPASATMAWRRFNKEIDMAYFRTSSKNPLALFIVLPVAFVAWILWVNLRAGQYTLQSRGPLANASATCRPKGAIPFASVAFAATAIARPKSGKVMSDVGPAETVGPHDLAIHGDGHREARQVVTGDQRPCEPPRLVHRTRVRVGARDGRRRRNIESSRGSERW